MVGTELSRHQIRHAVHLVSRLDVAQQPPLATFAQDGHLQRVAAQVCHIPVADRAVQRRSGDDAILAVDQFTAREISRGGTDVCANQSRRPHLRSCKRNHPRRIELTRDEQLADRDRILVVQMPYGLVRPDRIEQMNVGADESRRMRTFEFLLGRAIKSVCATLCCRAPDRRTQAHRSIASARSHRLEGLVATGDDDVGIRCQRIGIHRVDEDRMWNRLSGPGPCRTVACEGRSTIPIRADSTPPRCARGSTSPPRRTRETPRRPAHSDRPRSPVR